MHSRKSAKSVEEKVPIVTVMALDEDGLSEGWVRGHIDMALVGEDPLGILPIKWMRAKGGRNEAIY